MPITASLGALTYTKLNETGTVSDYWAVKGPTGSYSTKLFVDAPNESVYMVADGIYSIRITGFQVPTIQYNKQFYPSQYLDGDTRANALKFNNSSELVTVGNSQLEYRPAFPYYTVYAGYFAKIDKTVGDASASSRSYPYYGAPPSGNNQLRKSYEDFVVDSSNNYYMVGYDTEYYGTTNFRAFATVWKFNSSLTSLAVSGITDTTTGYFSFGSGVGTSSIVLDSSENPIISYGYASNTTTTAYKLILMKLSKTPSGGPNPTLPQIWKVGVTAPTNGPWGCSKILTDSTGNIYCTYYNSGGTTAGYIIKYDSTGTILWQKSIGIDCQDMVMKNDNEIYIVGTNASVLGYLVIMKIDDSGNLIFQRRIGPSSGTQGFQTSGSIGLDNDNMYVTGLFSETPSTQRPFLVKLPDDGTIPGTGTYIFNDNTTMTYGSSAYSYTAGSLSTFTPASGVIIQPNTLTGIGDTAVTLSTTRSISFL